jgi:hypothetical protein
VSEGLPRELSVALFLRDITGLPVSAEPVVPPVEPTVSLDPRLAAFATEQSAADWQSWWTWLLGAEREQPRGLDPREWIGDGARGEDLRALIDAGLDAAYTWADGVRKAFFEDFRRRTHEEALFVTRLVRDAGRNLGREVEPFDLRIAVLPVTGVWGCQAQERLLLVSRQMRRDLEAFGPLLDTVVRSLM